MNGPADVHRRLHVRIEHRQLDRVVAREALEVYGHPVAVQLRPRFQVLEHAAEYSLAVRGEWPGAFAGSRHVEAECRHALGQHGLRLRFDVALPGVHAAGQDHDGGRRVGGGYAQVADDLLALIGDAHDLEGRLFVLHRLEVALDVLAIGRGLRLVPDEGKAGDVVEDRGLPPFLAGRLPVARGLELPGL